MNIVQLPIEMLIEIFSYLSRYDEVCLVNKLFYSVECKLNDHNIRLRLDDRLIYNNWIPSILKSTRKIAKLDIYYSLPDEETCKTFISIVAKFGASIKCLRITGTRLTVSEFMEILSLIPNAEHLIFSCLNLRDNWEIKRRRVFDDNDLNLRKLKKLQFIGNNLVRKDKFLAVFDRLPVGVLQELELRTFIFTAAIVFLRRQTNIKRLEINSFIVDVPDSIGILDDLQLESLVICAYSTSTVAKILSKQTQLKTLSIPYTDTDEDLLHLVVIHLTKLERLSIQIGTPPSPLCIANISKLINLKDFQVSLGIDSTTFQLESLTRYSIGITSLEYIRSKLLSVDLVKALAKSLPKLKVLKLSCSVNSSDIINAVLTNFNFIEVLHIIGGVNGDNGLNIGNCFNPKLTDLIAPLPEDISRSYLTKLIADYPNLKKFMIAWDPVASWEFRQILDGFTKLESLTFYGSAEMLRVDDLDYLIDHRNHLKFVSLGKIFTLTNKRKRHFSSVFSVIVCNNDRFIMAVDRFAMQCRFEERKLITSPFDPV